MMIFVRNLLSRNKTIRYRVPLRKVKLSPVTLMQNDPRDVTWNSFKGRFFRFSFRSHALSPVWVDEGQVYLSPRESSVSWLNAQTTTAW